MVHRPYIDVHRHTSLAILLVLATSIATPACLQTKDGACILVGGDYACSSSQICLLPRSATRDFPGDQYGCHTLDGSKSRAELALDDAPEGMVRVPFGLPKRFESSFDGDIDSVEGVLTAAAQEQDLDIAGCDLEELRPTWSKLSEFVRDYLDRKGRVRVSSIVLDDTQIKWIEKFNGEVRGWFSAECVTMLPDTETGDTGTYSDGTGSGDTYSTSDDSTTGLPMPCVQDNGECPESMPFCDPVTGQCVRCDDMPEPDAACAGVDTNNPLCVEGSCVACIDGNPAACDDQLLVCDPGTLSCVPCAEHSDCPSGACDLLQETPTCFPNNVFNVGADQKYATIEDALNWVDSSALDRTVLRLHGSGEGPDFDESIIIGGVPSAAKAEAIAFIAAEDTYPLWSRTAPMGGPMLVVNEMNTRIYIDGVSLSSSQGVFGPGFICNGSAVDIRRSRFVQNVGGGIRASNGCTLHIQNTFIGGDIDGANAITISDSLPDDISTLDMLYTTIVANSNNGSSFALSCNVKSYVTVRNSIMAVTDFNDNAINCPSVAITNSATNESINGSTPVGNWDNDWFNDPDNGDFSLAGQGQVDFANIAIWQSGDPTTDIHGDPRPAIDGTSDYAGADVP